MMWLFILIPVILIAVLWNKGGAGMGGGCCGGHNHGDSGKGEHEHHDHHKHNK